eukprot:GILK01011850.1.p1 GENE.GILK01011850.1~~GILK01011850.1.p1  ORF type:complete len:1311 (+),score=265.06 GILK01011850.1:141-3935(+)
MSAPAGASSTSPEKPKEELKVEYKKLFRFADSTDKLLMLLGSIAAIGNGGALPAFSIVFGSMIDTLGASATAEDMYNSVKENALLFVYIGLGAFLLSIGEVCFWMIAAERQVRRMREAYLRAIMRQEVAWFDVNKPNELPSRLAGDCQKVQAAIGEKVGNYLHCLATFFVGFAVGFAKGWQLALVMLGITPFLGICGAYVAKIMQQTATKEQTAYAEAGGVADEVLGSIRTVAAFSGEEKELERYESKLHIACRLALRQGRYIAFGIGITFFMLFGSYAISFWFSSYLISEHIENPITGKGWTGGEVITVFFGILMGAFSIGQTAPHVTAFNEGRGAAYHMFEVLARQPLIDSSSQAGTKLSIVRGRIEFNEVSFTYPSRPLSKILNGLSLVIDACSTVALVGHSGCGKSTVIQLLERFYDPDSGLILIDGVDLRTLNVKHWRQQISLVGQEPVLFGGTIADNIAYGKANATTEEIETAAKKSNAHDFISHLPLRYDTYVGERGAQLSGGQKQRIAIARAIVRNPAILLLDEATSALDNKSEKIVQRALDQVMLNRTTIVVAHRLSTIQNADKIVVIEQGKVVEQGTHAQLIHSGTAYVELVKLQTRHSNQLDADSSSDDETVDMQNNGLEVVDQLEDRLDDVRKSSMASAAEFLHRVSRSFVGSVTGAPTELLAATVDAKDGVKQPSVPLSRIFGLLKPHWLVCVLGVCFSLLKGAVFPLYALVFCRMLKVFYEPSDELKDDSKIVIVYFVSLAVAAFCAEFFQISSFSFIGENLTKKLRKMSFKSMLRQNVSWFDEESNATGALTSKLATETSLVKGVVNQVLGSSIAALSGIGLGLGIAFYFSWKLCLVCLGSMPVIMLAGAAQMHFIKGFSENQQYEQAGRIASESISNIRTVSSFANEEKTIELYSNQLAGPEAAGVKRGYISGISFGAAQFAMFGTYALTFWFGGKLVYEGELGFEDMMRVVMTIILSATAVGQAAGVTPDVAKANEATKTIFNLIDTQPSLDYTSDQGLRPSFTKGEVEFRNVTFSYPSRSKVTVLKEFSFYARANETLALVGHSGCGKSTVIQLLERFYIPSAGSIFVDGSDISLINLSWLRRHIGLVGQEPVLFDTTIRNNIAYGVESSSDSDVRDAAKLANAHDFIGELDNGYETTVGARGTQLSGGQKQRIAIARAMIRNPRILLLDEATSALDAESELVVQRALDQAIRGRTTIVIAHRLSTIQDANCICVVHDGSVVEQGTHAQLLAAKGRYLELVRTKAN